MGGDFTKVYAVVGHDDISALFSRKEKAEHYINLIAPHLWIEEYELDPKEPERVYSTITYDFSKDRIVSLKSETSEPYYVSKPHHIGDFFYFHAIIEKSAIQEVMQNGMNSEKLLNSARNAWNKYLQKQKGGNDG